MIARLTRIIRSYTARQTAMIGVEKRRTAVKSVARQMREELGLAPDPRLS